MLFLYTNNPEQGRRRVLVEDGDRHGFYDVDEAFSFDHVRLYTLTENKIEVEVLAKVGPGADDIDFVRFWQEFTKLPPYLADVFPWYRADERIWRKGKRTSHFVMMKAGSALVFCEGDSMRIRFSPNTQFWLPGWDEVENDELTLNFLEVVA